MMEKNICHKSYLLVIMAIISTSTYFKIAFPKFLDRLFFALTFYFRVGEEDYTVKTSLILIENRLQ